MKISLFFRLFVLSLAISFIAYAVNHEAGLSYLAKSIALGLGISIIVSYIYPELRGVCKGDSVAVVLSNSMPFLVGRVGKALSNARKNTELRIRFDNCEEAVGIVESYEGFISPPKVRIIYEEKIIE